ncbi:MAG TPA: uridine kinase [Gammaproteobacteria bacterium]|nr:uridine kinase [Gammaproteobacteria bacterium]
MRRVIAIAGGSGSGKSTLAAALVASMGQDHATLLPIDAYYHDLAHLGSEEREAVNFDHPDALDLDLFAAHIDALRSGRAVACPTYDFTTHCRLLDTANISPRNTILVEGILVASRADLRATFDTLIFVATDAELRWQRRLQRDQHERGRDLGSIERFWARAEGTFAEWGARAESTADLVVDGGHKVAVMTELVADYLRQQQDH